jgi:flagellin
VTSAKPAAIYFRQSAIGTSVSLEVRGNTGTQVLSFVSGTKSSAIAYAVNQLSDSTGVSAGVASATNPSSGMIFRTAGFGSKQFVSVNVIGGSGTFGTVDSTDNVQQRVVGQDAVATVNGAAAIADGLHLSVTTASLNMELNLDSAFGTGSESFAITGGGAMFQLGAQVVSNQQVSIAIGSVAASRLGSAQYGYLSDIITGGTASLISGNNGTASQIIDQAISQVAVLRGRLGAFQANTVQTNINSLQVALENVTASESSIRDTDFAQETSNLTRNQILAQAGTTVLYQANQVPQQVLALLK